MIKLITFKTEIKTLIFQNVIVIDKKKDNDNLNEQC